MSEFARLDTMVTVVDAFNFLNDYHKAEELKERNLEISQEDDRTIVDLLIEQIEFADVLIINKTDLVDKNKLRELALILDALNPRARIILAENGKIPLESILNTRLFDFDKASSAAGWLQTLRGEHVAESEEYGISSFVYRARRPFHPSKFWQFVSKTRPNLLRSKGFFWLASHPEFIGLYSQAGGACRVEPAGVWYAEMPPEQWFADEETFLEVMKVWDEQVGDKRQALVFIGINLDESAITAELDACLVTEMENELSASDWKLIKHPFEQWNGEIEYLAEAAHAH